MDGLIRSRALVLDEMATRHRSQRTAFESTGPAQNRLRFRTATPRESRGARARAVVARSIHGNYWKTLSARARWRNRRWRNGAASSGQSAVERNSASKHSERHFPQTALSSRSFATTEQCSGSRKKLPHRMECCATPRAPCRRISLLSCAHSKCQSSCGWVQCRTIDSLVSHWRADIATEAGASIQATSAKPAGSSRISGLP